MGARDTGIKSTGVSVGIHAARVEVKVNAGKAVGDGVRGDVGGDKKPTHPHLDTLDAFSARVNASAVTTGTHSGTRSMHEAIVVVVVVVVIEGCRILNLPTQSSKCLRDKCCT